MLAVTKLETSAKTILTYASTQASLMRPMVNLLTIPLSLPVASRNACEMAAPDAHGLANITRAIHSCWVRPSFVFAAVWLASWRVAVANRACSLRHHIFHRNDCFL
jgi:hypothetical protein